MLRLVGDAAVVELAPEVGGAVTRYDVETPDGWQPILLSSSDSGRTGPFALASNVLAPWQNRISGGGFSFEGKFYRLGPNLAGERYPIHGNAFSSAWSVAEAAESRAALTLSADGPGPFRYDARLTYALEGSALRMSVALTNRGGVALPYGGGFHPWFPRTADARIGFVAAGVWTETSDHLPDRYLIEDPDWDFATSRPLPDRWLNNAFTGWSGQARIEWPSRRLAATIAADQPLRTLILYSPSATADFVSIEPVSHSVDAHNRSGIGVAPPHRLAPGETLNLTATITPERL